MLGKSDNSRVGIIIRDIPQAGSEHIHDLHCLNQVNQHLQMSRKKEVTVVTVQTKCHYHNIVIPLAPFVVDSRNTMNTTEGATHVITMKISQHLCLESISAKPTSSYTPNHKIMYPLTCKPATHKEAHGCILYCSYAQTLTPPIIQKQKIYSPLLILPTGDNSSFPSGLVEKSSITSTAPGPLAEMRRPTYTWPNPPFPSFLSTLYFGELPT